MIFQGRPLLDFLPHFESPTHGQLDDLTLQPAGIGASVPWKPTTRLKRTLKLPFQFYTREEWRAFRDFVASRVGRAKGFWLPVWLTDYPSTQQDQGTDQIVMRDIGLAGVFQPDEQFAFCALIKRGAAIEPNEILSVVAVGGIETITLETPIADSFPVESSVLCGMIFCRIDDEAIKYDFISDGVIRAAVKFQELPTEYQTDSLFTSPAYLFEFSRGAEVWRFTNWGKSIVLDGDLWVNASLELGQLTAGPEFISENISVTIATDEQTHPAMFHIVNRRAFERTNLTIFKIDASDLLLDRSQPFYVGQIGTAQSGGDGEIELTCTSNLFVGETTVPRTQNMRFCNLRNGDAHCGITLAAFATTANISALSNDDPPYIEAVEFGAKATTESDPNWFALGMVTIGNESRMCTGQNGNRLYLDYAFFKAVVGAAATAQAGDNKRIATCADKFNNLVNHLGFTYVPNRNPNLAQILNPIPEGGKK